MKMIYNIMPPANITAKNEVSQQYFRMLRRCQDVGLNISKIFEVSWMPTRPQMEIFAKRWGPFGSIASLYLLRVADNVNAVFLQLDCR